MKGSRIYIPNPTWANHYNIWRDAGVEHANYRYYKPETRGLDFDGLVEDIYVSGRSSPQLQSKLLGGGNDTRSRPPHTRRMPRHCSDPPCRRHCALTWHAYAHLIRA